MSGEGAVGVAVVAVVGGSIWLAARGLQAGALVAARSVDLLGAGLVAVGDRAEQRREQWESDHAVLMEWECAARRVLDVNARVEVLRRHATGDLLARLPAVLSPCAESPAALDAWCASATATLVAVEQELRVRTSAAVVSVLRHSVDLQRPVTAREAFDRYHRAMADAALRRRATPPDALVAVTRIVGRLAPDASDADRADVLAAAAQVAVLRPDVDHETLLDELRLRVQRAQERATTRRADAILAARLLQAVPDGLAGPPDLPELPRLRSELGEVVSGHRTLDPDLRARAEQAVEQVRIVLEREYVRASVADTLGELGYEVDQGFATVTGNPDRMRLVRPDWDGHAVQVVVDGDEVKAAVVRLADRTGADARREDVEREEQWCGDLAKLRVALDGSGVDVVERHIVPPGERIPSVVHPRDDRPQVAARERRR